jgi:selenocysteine lyase/cysteine desulfurase
LITPLSRSDFAVTAHYTYLNHAAVGVLPVATRDAVDAFVRGQAEGGVMGVYRTEAAMPEYREILGRFIGASGDEIAILRNTGEGATALALGIDWKPGDELVLCDNEFPSNAIPWLALRDRGVNVRFIPSERERMTPDVLRKYVSNRTRVVTVSWVGYADGYRHDLASLAEVTHDAGALFCVDAIQGLGAFPLDVRALGIDALYGGGQKWLMALQGVGYLYVTRELLGRLRLGTPGWRSVDDIWDFLNYDQPLIDDASRFEGGTPNFVGALSLATSLGVLQAAGAERIAAHVLAITDRLCEGLERLGAEVLTERGEGISSGIVTFRIPGCESIALGRTLQREGIITTWRASGIRVSPHGYNTADEIDRVLDLLPSCVSALTR